METTKKKQHKFTPKEDKYILNRVNKDASNLTKIFEECGKKFNTNWMSVKNHYYSYLAPYQYNNRETAKCFNLVSKDKVYPSYKNSKRGPRPSKKKPLNIYKETWNKIIEALKFK